MMSLANPVSDRYKYLVGLIGHVIQLRHSFVLIYCFIRYSQVFGTRLLHDKYIDIHKCLVHH